MYRLRGLRKIRVRGEGRICGFREITSQPNYSLGVSNQLNLGGTLIMAWLLVIGAVLFLLLTLRDRRDKARHAAGRCSYCADSFGPDKGFWLEGRTICLRCANRMRKRLMLAFAGMSILVGFSLAIGLFSVVRDLRSGTSLLRESLMFSVLPPTALGLLTVIAYRSMKASNQLARVTQHLELLQGHADELDGRSGPAISRGDT